MLPGLGLYLNIPIRVRLHWELNAGQVLYSVKDKNLDQVVFDLTSSFHFTLRSAR